MKSSFAYRQLLAVLLALALAQLACNLGAPSSSAGSAPTVASLPPATLPPATQPPAATQSTRGTPAEARTMLQKAVEHYNAVGRKQALADFTGRAAPFFDRDLYVACIDSKLVQSANGGFPNLVGSSTEPISRAAWDAATKTHVDSVSYSWLNPANNQMEPKIFFYEKVGADVCGVGAYNP